MNTIMKLIFGFLLFSTFSTKASAQAAPVCFQDLISFAVVKNQFPPILQTYPLYGVHQSFEFIGAFEIVANGNNLEIDGHVKPIIGSVVNESAIISEACLTGTELQVTLSNGMSETITVNASSLTIDGYDIDITDLATYQSVASQIPNQ